MMTSYLPATALQDRFVGSDRIDYFSISAVSVDVVEQASNQVKEILIKYHGGQDWQYGTKVATELAPGPSGRIRKVIQNTLNSIAFISLVVGGIGIMNLVLVSVNERTREIGLGKALGAKKLDILFQFLAESTLMSIVGGIIGIILGFGLAYGTSKV